MRVDVVTIFPDYLTPLDLSLIGKARVQGLLDLHVHDLREFTTDRHRTVDDTPYGGGAGMVMKPEPWAAALDAVVASGGNQDPDQALDQDPVPDQGQDLDAGSSAHPGPALPLLLVPGPGGEPFTQALAHELAAEPWLVFACGRYEGIDERVYDHAREALDGRVRVVSLGDYVLNGGEVAVLAMVEAIARLLPGVVGNAESLVEESHEDGLLEYPVYTKPASWRGRDVPPVLLSGNHGAIAAWRHQERLDRTAERRPDLLAPSAAADPASGTLQVATPADLGELLTLTHAVRPQDHETLAGLADSLAEWQTWVLRLDGRLVGSVCARRVDDEWRLARLMVVPDLADRGLDRRLLEHVRAAAPRGTRTRRGRPTDE
ncbi:tRNA (guanosine(37)-N1)-methyltransferase TrmD [Arsenicicoccus piscis]|nr:tRNA (guanosine(37)-N1)-methyltransferase TrmD [Arsenicicoccus piscis]